jgi:hypothetical protein
VKGFSEFARNAERIFIPSASPQYPGLLFVLNARKSWIGIAGKSKFLSITSYAMWVGLKES